MSAPAHTPLPVPKVLYMTLTACITSRPQADYLTASSSQLSSGDSGNGAISQVNTCSAHNGCGTWHALSMLAVATVIIATSITIITVTTVVIIVVAPGHTGRFES